ncbi:MAG: 30S ribosomal protein S6 [Candidatus Omnitrophica bacterium]|nr:30S ribosomal protein S6 [Candidatus Omnitrophota bacterium]
MNKYEAMFIIKPDLAQDDKESLFNQIKEVIAKNNGQVISSDIWAEKRKFYFPIKKYSEGLYYLMNFNAASEAIRQISSTYKVNENILRFLIIRRE